MVDEGEQFLVTDPRTRPSDDELKSVLEENAFLKNELTGVQAELAREQETVDVVRAELSNVRRRRVQTCLAKWNDRSSS